MDAQRRRERFESLADEPDLARRRLVALALVADRLAEDGIEPILVGGAALELYTAGGYATGDFEAPAPAGLPGETAPRTELEVEGMRVVVIGIEDLLLDRIRAAVHWKSDEDRRWARRLALLHAPTIDWSYLRTKTATDAGESAEVARLAEEGAK